jgi:dsRNA-specific ribonuclease
MAEENSILKLQEKIDYRFKKPVLLQTALLAAGANKQNYDGNRKLAQLGESMLIAALNDDAFSKDIPRRK